MTSDNVLLKSALQYLDQGFRVIACEPEGKKHISSCIDVSLGMPQKWASCPDILHKWWTKYPRANIGLATGFNFWVLDVDGPIGSEAFDALTSLDILDTKRVESGRGFHLYFNLRAEQAVPPTSIALFPGIDVRGVGGMIIAPPSIHENGKYYFEIRDDFDVKVVQPAPDWLYKLAMLAKPQEDLDESSGVERLRKTIDPKPLGPARLT